MLCALCKQCTVNRRSRIVIELINAVQRAFIVGKPPVINESDLGFAVERPALSQTVEAVGKLSKFLATFIRSNMDYFIGYDCVKIYYDNGQVELSRILASTSY